MNSAKFLISETLGNHHEELLPLYVLRNRPNTRTWERGRWEMRDERSKMGDGKSRRGRDREVFIHEATRTIHCETFWIVRCFVDSNLRKPQLSFDQGLNWLPAMIACKGLLALYDKPSLATIVKSPVASNIAMENPTRPNTSKCPIPFAGRGPSAVSAPVFAS